jgi:hypothetical protein
MTYFLFLLTFLGYPIIGLIFSKSITLDKISALIKPTVLLFLIHNVFFVFGYSLKGDYVDYVIFSLEYLALCLIIVSSLKVENIYFKIFRIIGKIAISFGVIIGLFGILMFVFVVQDYEADKRFYFFNSDKTYETRRYSFGTVSSVDTRYTFETYRTFRYFPFEKKIDVTYFFSTRTDLKIGEENLKISIVDTCDKEQILFRSTNEHVFLKSLN